MSNYSVYTGVWRDWSDGSTDGVLVLTVTQAIGLSLLSLLTFLVTQALGYLWAIVCFFLHQLRSTNLPRSGLHHQQQALLRSAPASSSVLIALLKMFWSWRTKQVGAVRHSAPLIITAALYMGILTASSILTSRVVFVGDQVLLRGGLCGWMSVVPREYYIPNFFNNPDIRDAETAAFTVGRYVATQSLNYGRTCYSATSSGDPKMCRVYVTPNLPFSSNAGVPCPFSEGICAQQDAFQIDTGYLDSNRHLGINTPADSRMQFRKLLTCAPILAEERYSSNWTSTPPTNAAPPSNAGDTFQYTIAGDSFRYYYLGEKLSSNFTYLIDKYTYSGSYGQRGAWYILNSIPAWSGFYDNDTFATFSPIPALRVNNSDVTLLFLTSLAAYLVPVHDPWFLATTHTDAAGFDYGPHNYQANRAVSVLACTEQYQLCASAGQCSPLDGLLAHISSPDPQLGLRLNDAQRAILALLLDAMGYSTADIITQMFGAQLLAAQDGLLPVGGLSAPLPPTQWHTEVRNVAATTLAMFQRRIVDFVAPPDIPVATVASGTVSSLGFIESEGLPAGERSLCHSVRIRDAGYYNFSVAGFVVILVVGVLIVVFNLACMPWVAFGLRKRFRPNEFATREWLGGDLFGIQRIVFEKHDVGPWSSTERGVPVTAENGFAFSADKLWEDKVEKTPTVPMREKQ